MISDPPIPYQHPEHTPRVGATCGSYRLYRFFTLFCVAIIIKMPTVAATDADQFWSEFNSEITLLQGNIVGAAQSSDMVALKDKLVEMQAFATNSTLVLANYDLKRAQEILETTSKYLKEKDSEVQPRKKFTFKSKQMVFEKMRADVEAGKNRGVNSKANQVPAQTGDSESNDNDETLYIVKDKEGDQLVLTTEMIGVANGVMRALLIRNCKGITLYARCVLGSVRIENCEDCRIFLGPCSTSVYLDSIIRGSVFICCHQLRIHRSKDVQLYVRVNGHPIVEDCGGMGFAPYQVTYAQLEADLKATGLEDAKCWDNVIDFRWHRSTQSPNWHVLPPSRRSVHEVVRGHADGDGETEWGQAAVEGSDGGGGSGVEMPPRPPSEAEARASDAQVQAARSPPAQLPSSSSAGLASGGAGGAGEGNNASGDDDDDDEM